MCSCKGGHIPALQPQPVVPTPETELCRSVLALWRFRYHVAFVSIGYICCTCLVVLLVFASLDTIYGTQRYRNMGGGGVRHHLC